MYKLNNYSELPSTQGIYFITNIINQKYYLGRAVNIKERYSWEDIEYSHHNPILKNSIIKYGRENFIVSVVEYPNISLEELINIEQGLLDIHYGLPLCYNKSKSASGGKVCEINPNYGKNWYNNGIKERYVSPDEDIPQGYILGRKEKSTENRLKQSIAIKGRIRINNGIDEKSIFPEEEIPEGYVKGRLPTSDETRIKQSIAHTGDKNSMCGKTQSKFSKYKNKIAQGIKVIAKNSCYYTKADAMQELNLSEGNFNKQFKKDPQTGFFFEIDKLKLGQ